MNLQILGLWTLTFSAPVPVETRLERLAPAPIIQTVTSPITSKRAVILLHGLRVQPVSAAAAARAEASCWETPQAPVVKALATESDVFAFHYAQTIALDDVARLPALATAVRDLRQSGYSEVVLVGFSVGGVIARQFVEDTPNSGVTKVIQVNSPNRGSDWTVLSKGVRSVQVPFVRSLTKDARASAAVARNDKLVPKDVEFACLVGVATWVGDGVVLRDSQWPADLQAQGIPATTIGIPHVGAMYSKRMADRVAELVRTPQPRWTAGELSLRRSQVLGPLAMFGGTRAVAIRSLSEVP